MVKNVADVVFGGLSYWLVGYSFSFGNSDLANDFSGWGNFLVAAERNDTGWVYSKFFFQASFATTATTIVSGAMAERTKLEAYMLFSFLNTFIFCFPAHWMWSENGFLYKLNCMDIAGAGPVHLVGGTTGMVATLLLRPRLHRFSGSHPPQMGSPTNALLGMFMLSAVSTIIASMGGGMVGMMFSYLTRGRKFHISLITNSILASLVSITAMCALAEPWQGFVIGVLGALLACLTENIVARLQIDDPVGVIAVHFTAAIWGLLAPGLMALPDRDWNVLGVPTNHSGLFYGGGFRLLGIQLAAVAAIVAWSAVTSLVLLKLIDLTIGLRVSREHEELGADLVEHDIGESLFDKRTQSLVLPAAGDNRRRPYLHRQSTIRRFHHHPRRNQPRRHRLPSSSRSTGESSDSSRYNCCFWCCSKLLDNKNSPVINGGRSSCCSELSTGLNETATVAEMTHYTNAEFPANLSDIRFDCSSV
uniref:Ammonium_transp domain-containing protein n=1 Tax=Macrostomum lignano TaxID=282301 RepID=A0A1I8JB34_9PLAT